MADRRDTRYMMTLIYRTKSGRDKFEQRMM